MTRIALAGATGRMGHAIAGVIAEDPLLTLTAATGEQLDVQAADLEQAAANVGVELQPLWGRQADGWVASLPLGRTLARRIGDR